MDDFSELFQYSSQRMCKIIVVNDRKILSVGTGCFVNNTGAIITAKHVLFERTEKAYNPYHGYILVTSPSTPGFMRYTLESGDLGFEIDTYGKYNVDLAFCKPETPFQTPHFNLAFGSSSRLLPGTPVILGGLPRDLKLFFNEMFIPKITEDIEVNLPGIPDIVPKEILIQEMFFTEVLKPSYISKNFIHKIEKTPYAWYILADHLSEGSSGGPILDLEGNLIGILTNKLYTHRINEDRMNEILIPSNLGAGLSIDFITPFLQNS